MTVSEESRPPALDVRLRPDAGDVVLDAAGDLDQTTGPLLSAAVESVLDAPAVPGKLVVDMSRVAFCDSGGLNALIRAHLRAREAGSELHLMRPTAPVAALLRRTGVDQVLLVGADPAAVFTQETMPGFA
ncbi:STAS domain-containing protein [Kitasatospora sp. NPDC059973]|uniref:STAS domain-containing protein n=1 Tax=Kitasatospora sp. NPDC059973 TaxID=3347020 RepID=UPI0036872052